MIRVFNFLSLRQWLTWPYALLMCGLAGLIGWLSYSAGAHAVNTVSSHLMQETLGRISQAVDRHVVGSSAVLEAAFPMGMSVPEQIQSELPAMRTRFWIATSLHTDPNNYVYYGNQNGQFFGLWRFDKENVEVRSKLRATEPRVFSRFSGINGHTQTEETEKKLYDPRQRPWFQAALKQDGQVWTSVYIDFRSNALVATRARRVLGAEGAFRGVVATDLSLQRLNDFVRNLRLSEHAVAFIVEPDGQLIASSVGANTERVAGGEQRRVNLGVAGTPFQQAVYAQVQKVLANNVSLETINVSRFNGPDGGGVDLAMQRLKDEAGLDWITVVAVPRSDYLQGVTRNVTRTALIGLGGIIVALALGLGILSWVGRDLRRLNEAVQAVGEGHLDAPLDIDRRDEIGVLAATFRKMQYSLRTDKLTGLANREQLMSVLGLRTQGGRRNQDGFAMLFIDLNHFKAINDRLGHAAGDAALIEVANRLRKATRSSDLVARYAGDEFVVVLNDIASRDNAEQVRSNIEDALGAPWVSIDTSALPPDHKAGGAVGLAVYPIDEAEAEGLIKHADRDMYERKRLARAP